MIGDNKFFSKNTDDGDHAVPGVQPIVRNASIENEMSQYVPSNTPIYTSQTPHRLLSKQDWGHVIEHKDLYAKADWEKTWRFAFKELHKKMVLQRTTLLK